MKRRERPSPASLGHLLLLLSLALAAMNFACSTYNPQTRRVISLPLPPPPSAGRSRVAIQAHGSLATAAEGELADTYVLPHSAGLGAALQFRKFALRLNGFVGMGASAGTSERRESTRQPAVFGPGIVLKTPMLGSRVEMFGAFDVMLAALPSVGTHCVNRFLSSPRCSDDEWLGFGMHFNIEYGLRVWLLPEVLATHVSVNATLTPFIDGSEEPYQWSGVTRAHLQWLPDPHIEFIIGGGVRYGGGPVQHGRGGVGFQFDSAIRVHIGRDPSQPDPELDCSHGPYCRSAVRPI